MGWHFTRNVTEHTYIASDVIQRPTVQLMYYRIAWIAFDCKATCSGWCVCGLVVWWWCAFNFLIVIPLQVRQPCFTLPWLWQYDRDNGIFPHVQVYMHRCRVVLNLSTKACDSRGSSNMKFGGVWGSPLSPLPLGHCYVTSNTNFMNRM